MRILQNQTATTKTNTAGLTGIESNYGAMSMLPQGIISVLSSCGPIGATCESRLRIFSHGALKLEPADVTPVSGPNGNIDWLNCGVNEGGWQPPYVIANDLITKDLLTAIQSPHSPFKACAPFLNMFEQYAHEFGGASFRSHDEPQLGRR